MKLRASILFALAAPLVAYAEILPTAPGVPPCPPLDVIHPDPTGPLRERELENNIILNWGTPRPEHQARTHAQYLQETIGLSHSQAYQIELILTQEAADCQALPVSSHPATASIRLQARDRIRALLTPDQRAKFNLVPLRYGGGLIGKSPWDRVDELDRLVHLTPDQKTAVLRVYIVGTEFLMEHRAPEHAGEIRQVRGAIQDNIRALLTPEQQKAWDSAPRPARDRA